MVVFPVTSRYTQCVNPEINEKKNSDMQTAQQIMNKHFKECFETHNEKVSDKYILYFHKAMKEYAQQEREKAISELLVLIENKK